MRCEKCGKEFTKDDKIYTAVGINICEKCNSDSGGTVSMDMVFDKIIKEKSKN